MDLARKILQSYGWKDGDGLGKKKDGIAKPLRATLKFDNSGFGANQAEIDFNNHWWERVYNEATTNVKITKEGEQIQMSLKDNENDVEISTKGYSIKKMKKLKHRRGDSSGNKSIYNNFLQAATLTEHGSEIENPNKIDTDDIDVSNTNILTDEELFKACGGRTAHKGARHGLKQSGKLSRLEKQEAEMLAKMMAKHNCSSDGNRNESMESKDTLTNYINDQSTDTGKIKSKTSEKNFACSSESIKVRKKKRKHDSAKAVGNIDSKNKILAKKARCIGPNDMDSLNVDIV